MIDPYDVLTVLNNNLAPVDQWRSEVLASVPAADRG